MATEQSGGDTTPAIPGILLTGDSLPLPAERYEMLEQMLGGLGVTLTQISDIRSLGIEVADQSAPIPASRADFVAFARGNGYTDRMAHNSWNSVVWTTNSYNGYSDLPNIAPLRFVGHGHDVLDLRSLKARLETSRFTTGAWWHSSPRKIGFLRALVEAQVGFDEDRNPSDH